jgi:hypothetical protein
VWRLWAGAVPDLDGLLSRSALADLDQAAREIGEPPRAPDKPKSRLARIMSRPAPPEPEPDAWRQQAYQAERERNYAAAAQLYARHGEPLHAARMWEREAEEKY